MLFGVLIKVGGVPSTFLGKFPEPVRTAPQPRAKRLDFEAFGGGNELRP